MSRFKSLELFKFSLYVTIPIFTTYVYMQPDVVREIVTRLGYINYPAQELTRDEVLEKMKRGQEERKRQ
ncbi:unnamed protein product [Aphanomyces euteiches]|uniref:Uncharacterized protein n=1 Tax=Aphanomyces euteiches TaxID=100861 RepID=A0A6G0W938_9STRA|nr:hypothetical protein Ae201684_018218 [Aphanomyces euteiches]KAG9411403.1 hypothetical protein AC1031_017043 [Aphanomyces cochlioides]KAH9076750.1 hypothetical protein Ae201684P_010684 [Aphanomyces euteiches]KAH9129290.1 hypothetical protein AeMF1_000648 [Aphanomyces euteiches]KAH9130856.1 hypothetical protein LEN26_008148 [Aphanomyces euteiches]